MARINQLRDEINEIKTHTNYKELMKWKESCFFEKTNKIDKAN